MTKMKWLLTISLATAILVSASALLAQGHGQGQKNRSADTLKQQEKHLKGKAAEALKQSEKGNKDEAQMGSERKEGHVPPGQMKKEERGGKVLSDKDKQRPAGWERGEKEGWESSVPPGWEKWGDSTRSDWQKELENAKGRVRDKAKKARKNKAEIDSACVAVEAAARRGVPSQQAEAIVTRGMDKGLKGRELAMATRAMADGVARGVEAASLSEFVQQKLDEGIRGDALALQIQEQVRLREEEMQKAAQAEEEKQAKPVKRWWEFWK